jgi:zinc D-Ala-D-Ala carboxypeptidase
MRVSLASVKDLRPDQWHWPHVDPAKEWACKGTGKIVIETDFLDRFEKLRRMFGGPLIITSGYRSPEHNLKVAESGAGGPHTTGRAVDIRIYGEHAIALVHLALEIGFTGVGVSQKGEQARRYIHLDDLQKPAFPRPMIWSY